ncbi:hypothetical protein BH09PAT1_BH09PAT1_4370 [soil metagenome]
MTEKGGLPDNITKFARPKKQSVPIFTDQPMSDYEFNVSNFVPIPEQKDRVVSFDREVWRRDAENAIKNMMKDRGVAFVHEVIAKKGQGEL